MPDQPIEFTLRLTEEDWDPNIGAWRCPAFDIPSSYAKEVYAKRERLAATMFKVEKGPARLSWMGGKHPEQIVVVVAIGERLSPTSAEDWWKRFAIIVPIIAALIAASATYASRPPCDTKVLSEAAASVAAAANEQGAFTATATGNVCSGGAHGVPPTDAGGLARLGSAIQAKLNSIATSLANAAKK
jgi:hypothetical protein